MRLALKTLTSGTKYFCDHLLFLFFYFRSTLITFLLNVHRGLFGICGSKSEQTLLSAQLLEMLSMTLSLKGDKKNLRFSHLLYNTALADHDSDIAFIKTFNKDFQ